MSASLSTRTKSLSESVDSESTVGPLIFDRWTNNISYRQLVISSCIGIFQLWWHPYLYDFQKFMPFMFLYQIFSIFIAYPLFYLELALGVVTKKGVLKCWDFSPMARGVGFAMASVCIFSALVASAVGAWCLALLVHSAHAFLPWLHCAASAKPPCAARHRPLTADSETPPQSFFFNYVLNLKRDGLAGGLGNVVWELSTYYIICWVLIYFVVIKRIYSYSKLVLFKDALTYFVLVSCGVGVMRLEGATRIFMECNWNIIFSSLQLWGEALEYSLVEMTISQGSLIMLGSYCPKAQHKLGSTAMYTVAVSKLSCMAAALILGATHGALSKDYENVTNINADKDIAIDSIRPRSNSTSSSGSSSSSSSSSLSSSGPSMYQGTPSAVILWADFVARVPGSQFWSALVFFTLFLLAITTAAMLVQTVMSTFTGHSIRKITWAFLIVICFLLCLIGVLTLCTQGGLYIMNFLLNWPVSKPRVLIAAIVATVVTYVYGQTTFCEDVYFAVGEYPSMFMRVSWALSPALMMIAFAGGVGKWEAREGTAGWILVGIMIVPIAVIMLIYAIFKCRVRNIVRDEK